MPQIVTGLYRHSPDGSASTRIRLTGDFGGDPASLWWATVRDHRVVDWQVFQGRSARAFIDFVYFFLGEPEACQARAHRGRCLAHRAFHLNRR